MQLRPGVADYEGRIVGFPLAKCEASSGRLVGRKLTTMGIDEIYRD